MVKFMIHRIGILFLSLQLLLLPYLGHLQCLKVQFFSKCPSVCAKPSNFGIDKQGADVHVLCVGLESE